MNVDTFFKHYDIQENPFESEEARHDSIFARIETVCHHPDYTKIRGNFQRPSSAIVFGERGAGKTAIRLQIEDDIREYNRSHPDRKCLAIAYDELNPVLDRLHRRVGGSADDALSRIRLVDHIDGIMNAVVPGIVDQILGDSRSEPVLDVDGSTAKRFRQLDRSAKRDFMMLQICYDRPEEADLRTGQLRNMIRGGARSTLPYLKWGAGAAAVLTIGLALYFLIDEPEAMRWLWVAAIGALAVLTVGLGARLAWLWWKFDRLAGDLSKNLRVMARPRMSFRKSLTAMRAEDVLTGDLPRGDGDDQRYAMIGRLQHIIRPLGYQSVIVLFDRIDEPSLVNGEPKRMQSIVWPMLNSKFLQQERFAVKMLLPLDLKHELFRETGEFFREARLDKQNLVERLTWSGATLYDICTTRLIACRPEGAETMSLTDLFEDEVRHQDLIDALDQLQQPRDAFKFMYQVIQEHCSAIPEETPQWKIPRLVLDNVRKQQVERMGNMLRGVRPA